MKKIITNRILAKAALVVAMLIVLPVSVFGYQVENIDVSNVFNKDFVVGPGKSEVELKPGEERIVNILVSNRMGETKTFTLEVEDFIGSKNPQETVVLLGDDRGPYSLKDYISVPERTFELKNGERATVPVKISVPSDAQPGGLYGSVLVSIASKSTGSGGASAIVSRIGTLFFVNIPGDVVSDGKLVDFETAGSKKFYGKGPINFRLLYENNGSVHLNPYGEIKITNMFGEEVGKVEIDPWFAMPGALRLREVSWDRPFLFGFYKAHAEINRGYDDIIDSKTLTFFVIPWHIIVIALVSIAVLVFALRFVFSHFEIRRK
jgi:hypothetical protein